MDGSGRHCLCQVLALANHPDRASGQQGTCSIEDDSYLPLVTISDVRLLETRPDDVLRFELDSPSSGSETDAFAIKFEGTVVVRNRRPASLELSGPGVDGERLPVGVLRPDLREAYPDIRWAVSNSGFQAQVGA